MALTVEDGSIVAGADSYGDEAGFTAWAASLNLTLAGDASSQEADMRRAGQYLDRQYQFIGVRVDADQEMQWPRLIEDYVEGFSVPSNAIPSAIVDAQYEIAWLLNQGNDLFAYSSGAATRREKVKAGPVEVDTEYAASSTTESRLLGVEGLLRPYLIGGLPGQNTAIVPLRRN